MLNFVFGRSGYGKTEYIFSKIKNCVDKNEDVVLITPEQFSFLSEKKLLDMLGEANVNQVQCFSFTRLANEAKRLYGADILPALSKGAKAVIMKRAIDTVQNDLHLFGKKCGNISFISSMVSIYDEMKSCNLDSNEIKEASTSIEKQLLKEKLYDFSLIISAYDNIIEGSYVDPSSELTRLYKRLIGKNYFENKTVFIDGFNGFVAQEYKILEIVISESKDVTIALDSDSFGTDDKFNLFAYVNDSANILCSLAKKFNVNTSFIDLKNNYRSRCNELLYAEKYLFSDKISTYEEKADNIRIYSSKSICDECDDVSLQIKKLLRQGYRARDIAVTVRDINKYKSVLESSFIKYELPYFVDERQPIESQPIIVFALYLLRICAYGFDSSDILSLLKTGLTDAKNDDIALLENYVFTWNINGSQWKNQFVNSPKGYASEISEYDDENLRLINNVRRIVIEPIISLQNNIKNATPKQICKSIFLTIKEFSADKHLSEIAHYLLENNKSALAFQQKTAWDILMDILNQIAISLPEDKISIKDFLQLYSLIISTEDLGEIPVGIDNIQFGQADRMRFDNPKAVFVLGANEGEFPQAVTGGGLLTDSERKVLAKSDFKLYSFGEILNLQERYFAYKVCSAPTEKLFVSYLGNTGRDNSPSEIITSLTEIFPNININIYNENADLELVESRQSAFELMAKSFEISTPFYCSLKKYFSSDKRFLAVKNIADNVESVISNKNLATNLFDKKMLISASRIEDYYNCAFRYFCKFGIGAKPRQKAEINPMSRGTLIHYVLEKVIMSVGSKALSQMDEKEIMCLVDKYVLKFFKEEMGNPDDITQRFKYNFLRLSKMIYSVLFRLSKEFAVCDFEAKAFELPIDVNGAVKSKVIPLDDGGEIRIHGSIDRVDILNKNQQQYVRIVDYKTGAKEFKLCDVVNGLNLQMLIYLFNLCSDKNCDFCGIPAGVLYMHSSRSLISSDTKSTSEKVIKTKEDKDFKMNGIIIDDSGDVAFSMEHDLSGKFIPVSVGKDGDITGSLASLEELGLLENKINSLVAEMGLSLHSGIINQNPVKSKSHKKTCEYCDYATICSMKKYIDNRCYDEIKDDDVKKILKEGIADA